MTDHRERGTDPLPSDSLDPISVTLKPQNLSPLAAAVVAGLSPQAQAQDDGLELEEIIVTATKRELSMQDVAQAIDVLSTEQLERMGARDIESTLRALPSLSLNFFKPGLNSLTMRGVSTGPFEFRTEATVAVYLDEQPLTFNSQQVSFRNVDIARVEHLPGPQGTLFGSSSQTGTIRWITNKPHTDGFTSDLEGRYGITKGGADSYEVSGVFNIPVVEDKLAVRAIGYTSHEGGYMDNVLGTSLSGNFDNAALVENDYNDWDVTGGRISALWTVNEDWSVLLAALGEDTEAIGTWSTDPALGDYRVTRFNPEFRTDDWTSTALTVKGDLGFAELSVTATKFERDIAYQYDNVAYIEGKDRYFGGGRYYEELYAGNPYYYNYYNFPLYDTEYNNSRLVNDQKQDRETLEVRLTSQGDSRFQWMVGGYFEDVHDRWFYFSEVDNLSSTRAWATANAYAYYYSGPHYYAYTYYPGNPYQAYPLPDSNWNYTNDFDKKVQQTAFFGEMSYDLTDDLTVIGGIRWAEFDRDINSQFGFPFGLAPIGDRSTGDGTFRDVGKDSDTIYKVSLRYNLDDDKMVYALYSQGFRVGGTNSQRAARTGQVPLTYNSDFLNNYEFGIKSQWLNNSLTLNAQFFLMQWDDFHIGQSFDRWWLRGVVNATDAETRGVEIDATWQVTDNLQLTGTLFAANPEFKRDFIDGTGELAIRAGMRMPNSPERTAHASLYYDIPTPLFGGNGWVYYDVSYGSETWVNTSTILDNDQTGRAPSWVLHGLSAGLYWQNNLELDITVRNLFDQRGYNYIERFQNSGAEAFGDPRFQNLRPLDRPRTIWLTLRKSFGD